MARKIRKMPPSLTRAQTSSPATLAIYPQTGAYGATVVYGDEFELIRYRIGKDCDPEAQSRFSIDA